MKNVTHRPCTICALGHFKCNKNSVIRTCSSECSKIYAKNATMFSKFARDWYKALDVAPRRRAIIMRIGNGLVFKSDWEQTLAKQHVVA